MENNYKEGKLGCVDIILNYFTLQSFSEKLIFK